MAHTRRWILMSGLAALVVVGIGSSVVHAQTQAVTVLCGAVVGSDPAGRDQVHRADELKQRGRARSRNRTRVGADAQPDAQVVRERR